MILLDTSVILGAIAEEEPRHLECGAALQAAEPPIILSPFVLAEADYMLQKWAGIRFQLEFLKDVAGGAFDLVSIDRGDVDLAREIMSRYRELDIGLTDASIVVLAKRYECWDVLTLDERHFRALRVPGSKRPFRLLPADG